VDHVHFNADGYKAFHSALIPLVMEDLGESDNSFTEEERRAYELACHSETAKSKTTQHKPDASRRLRPNTNALGRMLKANMRSNERRFGAKHGKGDGKGDRDLPPEGRPWWEDSKGKGIPDWQDQWENDEDYQDMDEKGGKGKGHREEDWPSPWGAKGRGRPPPPDEIGKGKGKGSSWDDRELRWESETRGKGEKGWSEDKGKGKGDFYGGKDGKGRDLPSDDWGRRPGRRDEERSGRDSMPRGRSAFDRYADDDDDDLRGAKGAPWGRGRPPPPPEAERFKGKGKAPPRDEWEEEFKGKGKGRPQEGWEDSFKGKGKDSSWDWDEGYMRKGKGVSRNEWEEKTYDSPREDWGQGKGKGADEGWKGGGGFRADEGARTRDFDDFDDLPRDREPDWSSRRGVDLYEEPRDWDAPRGKDGGRGKGGGWSEKGRPWDPWGPAAGKGNADWYAKGAGKGREDEWDEGSKGRRDYKWDERVDGGDRFDDHRWGDEAWRSSSGPWRGEERRSPRREESYGTKGRSGRMQ